MLTSAEDASNDHTLLSDEKTWNSQHSAGDSATATRSKCATTYVDKTQINMRWKKKARS